MKSVGYPFVWPGDRKNVLVGFDCSSHARAPESKNQLADERIAVARDVIAGKYGNGEDRVRRLRAAGWIPAEIQMLVNTIIKLRMW